MATSESGSLKIMAGAVKPECGALHLLERGGSYESVSQPFDLYGFTERVCPARSPYRFTAQVLNGRINCAETDLLAGNEYRIMFCCHRPLILSYLGLAQTSLASASIEKRPSRWKS